MMDIKIPARGTRVSIATKPALPWMWQFSPPIIGIVAHSNPWDKPETIRLIGVDNCLDESTIALDHIRGIEILGTSTEPTNPNAALEPQDNPEAQTFEVEGSTGNLYTVIIAGNKATCNCTAGQRGRECRHIKEVKQRLR
jgi:hypothetical protein